MMLKLRFRNEKDTYDESIVEHDIEKLFFATTIEKNDLTVRLLKQIENAEYVSSSKYRDRFGIVLSISDLSTGTKAALCVQYHTDRIIDLVECGFNAIDAILENCKDGCVLDSEHTTACYSAEGDISVELDGKEFTSIDALNEYIMER
ncbi:MAG: hypothetical protein IKQ27_01145 [Lachnospiraceae bacterium]|nr:hypothetical protein [Lachnospiraceae bacterium]MBR3736249.1 hypothetical protein [Lachnospiraceae bacterium]MBR6155536.1 hypothetical protein [Lachnospiraceae bacterium]